MTLKILKTKINEDYILFIDEPNATLDEGAKDISN
jgi:hypothetical protein